MKKRRRRGDENKRRIRNGKREERRRAGGRGRVGLARTNETGPESSVQLDDFSPLLSHRDATIYAGQFSRNDAGPTVAPKMVVKMADPRGKLRETWPPLGRKRPMSFRKSKPLALLMWSRERDDSSLSLSLYIRQKSRFMMHLGESAYLDRPL